MLKFASRGDKGFLMFRVTVRSTVIAFSMLHKSVLVTRIVKPWENVTGGTANQNAIASSAVFPSSTPSPQSRVMLVVADSDNEATGACPNSAFTVACPAIFSLLFPVMLIDLTLPSPNNFTTT